MNKMVLCDIDGVLAQYPEYFIEFIKSNICMYKNEIIELKSLNIQTLFPKLNEKEFMALKEKYRASGVKAKAPAFETNIDGLRLFSQRGYPVYLMTTRPGKTHTQVHSDTISWIENNGIPCNDIIWTDDKISFIDSLCDTKNLVIIDDDIEIANVLTVRGYKVYLVDRPYNMESALYQVHRGIRRVKSILNVVDYELNVSTS